MDLAMRFGTALGSTPRTQGTTSPGRECVAKGRCFRRLAVTTVVGASVALPASAASADACTSVDSRSSAVKICCSNKNQTTELVKSTTPSARCSPPRTYTRKYATETLPVAPAPALPRKRRRGRGGDGGSDGEGGDGGDGGDDGRGGGDGWDNWWNSEGSGGDPADILIWHGLSLISLAYCLWHVITLESSAARADGSRLGACPASISDTMHSASAARTVPEEIPEDLPVESSMVRRRCAWPLHQITYHLPTYQAQY